MGFQRLFWGLPFLFDFRLNGFDVLPDAVGFLLLADGCQQLARMQPKFADARRPILVALLLSIPDFFPIHAGNPSAVYIVYSLVMMILSLNAVYHLAGAIRAWAVDKGETDIAQAADRRWLLFAVATVAGALYGWVGTAMPSAALGTALFLLTLVALGMQMGLMAMCRRRSDPRE